MFGLLTRWRRKRLQRREMPREWVPMLERNVPFYRLLPPDERDGFHDKLKLFVWEKHFIGAKGFEVTDEMRVVIGAAAVRLIRHLDLSFYDRLTEIVVYPTHYKHKDGDVLLGEAHQWGTVVLSWPAVLSGLHNPCDGHDTAIHEFAHVLDRASGRFDGTPNLRASEHYRPWAQVMSLHFRGLERGGWRQRRILRGYGAKNEAEFFAVATEAFFERPLHMIQVTPDLYEELKRFYGFDPSVDPTCGRG